METLNQSRLKALNTNLMVDDVAKTLIFYESIGFTVLQKAPKEKPEWAFVEKDGVSLMFQSTSSLQQEFEELKPLSMGAALTFWIQVENIEAYYEEVKGKAKVIKPLGITAYNGATEFVIQDINNFILHFSNLDL